ncbi:MAG: DUF2282 domain-containing protein [Alphaproteobacteria bacterium]|nr:DUF2282 domain-containing protein [Alphaproteobacteria bacterium]
MNSKTLLSSLAITSFAASLSSSVVYAEEGFKCYGVSAPGGNACNALDHNEHDCAAASDRDHHLGDWKVATNEAECKKLGGLSEAEARKKLGLPSE